jgi:hypothetical protein
MQMSMGIMSFGNGIEKSFSVFDLRFLYLYVHIYICSCFKRVQRESYFWQTSFCESNINCGRYKRLERLCKNRNNRHRWPEERG